MRRNRRPEFLNPLRLRVQLDEGAVRSSPPRISERIKTPALGRHHVGAAVQIQYFPCLNLQHLDGIAPISRSTASPIFSVVGDSVVVTARRLQRPLLQGLAGYRIEFGNPVRARIPHEAFFIKREISEARRIQRDSAFDADLFHVAGFWIQPVQLVSPVFRDPHDAVFIDLLVMRSRHDSGS